MDRFKQDRFDPNPSNPDRSSSDRFDQEDFEKELRTTLRRQKPSDDFEARVADGVARTSRRKWWPSILAGPQLRWAAVAGLCLLIGGGITHRREQQLQRAQGEAARQQVMAALRIAGSKMKLARTKVQSLSQR